MLWLSIQQQVLHHLIIMTSQEKKSQKVMAHLGKKMEPKSKGEKIDYMKDAVAAYVVKLYEEGKIDGIISVGGLQNTVMAANAMQKLPIGFPKVMATTVASGTRKFDLVVGDKDITVMPAICDFTGLNIVTRQVISNACACCVGMVKCAGQVLTKVTNRLLLLH